jgi:hypothetical protein
MAHSKEVAMPLQSNLHIRQDKFLQPVHQRAREAMWRALKAGAKRYERNRDLPGLAHIDPRDLAEDSIEKAESIVERLARALRAERRRARSGHWTYDLNRHIALRQAHLAETTRLRRMMARRAGVEPAARLCP